MTTSVLVTRPAGQAQGLLDALCAAGFGPVHHFPMLVLEPLEQLAPEQHQHLLDLDLYQHVIFISANAVRFGLERVDEYWPQLPIGINWYAIGDTTARLLQERGLEAITPGETMSSEGLLSRPELQSVEGQRVLIFKGQGGRETLRKTLVQRGARVDELAETIADNAPLTVRGMKFIATQVMHPDPSARDIERCDAMVAACFESEDYVEGRKAFMEKRKPDFKGR